MASDCAIEAATVWLEIESTVKRLSRTWLAKAGYYTNADECSDVIGEIRVRFLASFKPDKSRNLPSTLAYARRCCLSAVRSLSPPNDLATYAVRGFVELSNVACERGEDEGCVNAPALGDLSPKLSRRVAWFAAHPKQVSQQVRLKLRLEISAHIRTVRGQATHRMDTNIYEKHCAEGDE